MILRQLARDSQAASARTLQAHERYQLKILHAAPAKLVVERENRQLVCQRRERSPRWELRPGWDRPISANMVGAVAVELHDLLSADKDGLLLIRAGEDLW